MTRLPALVLITALMAAAGSAAFAQGAPTAVRGELVSLAGNTMTVKTATSTVAVTVPDDLRVQYVVKSDISKIGPGTFIGTAAVPQADGSYRALEIQFFNQQNHPGETDRAWDVAPKSTMTNATIAEMSAVSVDKVDGRMLTLKWAGGEKKIFVPASAPVVSFEPATRAALVPGANVMLFAVKKDDGSMSTPSVNVGKDGLKIPY